MYEGKDEPGALVALGTVAKAHGIRGEIKVYAYSGQPENFLRYQKIFLMISPGGTPEEFQIEKSGVAGKFALLSLKECHTRNQAEALIGSIVSIPRTDLPEPDEDEFYLTDLEGKDVIDTEGRRIGRIQGFLQTGAQDLAVVKDRGREYLVPVIKDFIVGFDGNEVVVNLPPGLLDINNS